MRHRRKKIKKDVQDRHYDDTQNCRDGGPFIIDFTFVINLGGRKRNKGRKKHKQNQKGRQSRVPNPIRPPHGTAKQSPGTQRKKRHDKTAGRKTMRKDNRHESLRISQLHQTGQTNHSVTQKSNAGRGNVQIKHPINVGLADGCRIGIT